MRALLLLSLVPAVVFAAPKKPVKAKKPTVNAVAEAEVKKALDSTQEKVGSCVIGGAGAGAWTQVIRLKVIINGVDQVMSLTTTLEPANEKADVTKKCIDDAVRAAAFPSTHAPMVTVEREWTFRME